MNAPINISTLAESKTNTGLEHFHALVELHKEFFPEGMSYLKLSEGSVTFISTIRNSTQWFNGIEHNDPMRTMFTIEQIEDTDKFTIELYSGDSLCTKPPAGSHLYFGSAECKFRKSRGDFNQVMKKLRAWEEKRLQVVEENKDNMKS